ncbi:hypothetical protein [Nitriliruptor alkaliphilus]|uniref:hypothetical protein n=1 Tax=Nitriliruptor alkaliphilus TaxID=427918 RepID=UPI000698A0B7|nr:hypothetical protein [Nitriliruptor alkaliphilus]
MQYPYAEVEFTSTGTLHDPAQQAAALDLVRSSGATDVLIVVHGWNNDMGAARRLFEDLTGSIAAVSDAVPEMAARRLAVIGVLWPSVRWADDDQIAGGGVGFLDEQAALQEAIVASVDNAQVAAELAALVPQLEHDAGAREQFLDLLRERMPEPVEGDEDPPPSPLLEGDAATVLDDAAVPEDDLAGAPEAVGGGAVVGGFGGGFGGGFADGGFGDAGPGVEGVGGGAGFSLGGVLRGARNVLNLTTYYTMKRRAGDVGERGVAPLLAALDRTSPTVRRHLAGHSFGARVVAAAVTAGPVVDSVALLQGAFSHHGFAEDHDGRGNDGSFRGALAPQSKVRGPVIVTHTVNDRAVGLAYAAASRIARQRASGFGGPNDVYGGIGRNGALRTPESRTPGGELLEVGAAYDLEPGRVHNLRADRFITGHSAVTGRQVGYAVLRAMVSGTGRR